MLLGPPSFPLSPYTTLFRSMSGYKKGLAGAMQLERAVRWMRTLNKDAADVLRGLAPNAVADVTGFGLFGHAHEMAQRSGVRRSEEHTSELQSPMYLVCRLLL